MQRCVFTPVEETGGWSLNWVKQTWMCVYKQMGTWISLDHQDNGGNPFGLQPVFALLSLWEHTGWKDCKGMKYRKETYSDIFKLNKNNLEKIQLSVETKTKTSVRRGRSCNQQILRWPGYLKCVGESLC